MERLEKSNPPLAALTEEQKTQLAEIDTRFRAKIAEREVFLGGLLAKARAAGSYGEIGELEEQLAREVRRLREQCEDEKERFRSKKG